MRRLDRGSIAFAWVLAAESPICITGRGTLRKNHRGLALLERAVGTPVSSRSMPPPGSTYGPSYSDDRTLDPELGDRALSVRVEDQYLALAIAWSADEPWRVGEVALVPVGERHSVILGRGGRDRGERIERAALVRQRPGINEATAPLASRRISRAQLRLRATGNRQLLVQNIGRCPLRVGGERVEQTLVGLGDTLELEGQLLLHCTLRPTTMPALRHLSPSALHPFGEIDAHGIVGESSAVWRLRDLVAFVATRPGHVLVRGPSGSGKELVATAIHQSSPRAGRRLVARNAATIPSSLMDAELFGHVKDYPNVGMSERRGLVGEADGSTLFLDEVGELSHDLQAHLLRLMDGGEYQRLGRTETLQADVRLVGATNRKASDLKADFGARFRHVVDVPSLSERKEDVPLLVRHLLRKALSEDETLARRFMTEAGEPRVRVELLDALLRHPLPLQVRQLDTILWQCLASSAGDEVELAASLDLSEAEPEGSAPEAAGIDPASLEPSDIQACLDKHQGVQEKVWRELGLQNRYVLRRLIKKHGLRSGGDDPGSDGGPTRP